ncbi:hypothetical protein [Cellulomonas rhizosphaerae]|uniref:Uncharacterized protein n=1 Tax=Cellulomonas rhizosphaerae TaxID=2293719 RepID=A0A413RQB5_9CELL|nr:hypothetical protein [Cellulomonas rhizosphaerae]RHA44147.1 hypothetical protein D1825_02725 [Cellulomonas rhizosphaerae]
MTGASTLAQGTGRRVSVRTIVAAVLIGVVTLNLVFYAAVWPITCPLVYPPPPGCEPDRGHPTAWWAVAAIGVTTLATIVLALRGASRRARWFALAACLVVGLVGAALTGADRGMFA